jgi:hypothetical protein
MEVGRINQLTEIQLPKGDRVIDVRGDLFERQERSYLMLLYRKHREWFHRKIDVDKTNSDTR